MWYLKQKCILRPEPFFDSSSLSVCLSPSVCKFVSIEMKSAFDETGKTKEVIDRNYGFIDNKGAPPIKYVKSWVCLYVFGGEGSRLRQRGNPCPCCGRPSCSSWSQLSLSVGGLLWIEVGSCCCNATAELRANFSYVKILTVINISVLRFTACSFCCSCTPF